jgi:hypothetical protein
MAEILALSGLNAALSKYYSYHTEVFVKCLNGCMQCNQHAEAEKCGETMLEILALLALQCQNTIAIIQRYFSNVLMVMRSVINVPRPKKAPRQCWKFWRC